jgi:hypothetical protein
MDQNSLLNFITLMSIFVKLFCMYLSAYIIIYYCITMVLRFGGWARG